MSVWQHTLVGSISKAFYRAAAELCEAAQLTGTRYLSLGVLGVRYAVSVLVRTLIDTAIYRQPELCDIWWESSLFESKQTKIPDSLFHQYLTQWTVHCRCIDGTGGTGGQTLQNDFKRSHGITCG